MAFGINPHLDRDISSWLLFLLKHDLNSIHKETIFGGWLWFGLSVGHYGGIRFPIGVVVVVKFSARIVKLFSKIQERDR
ncbi:hypothetical protein [Chamaesiphon sp. GL140_3_metabinner_50]|uniref:hypothetical protein n=1 Tax=Chamaesiphon sp. GL140_3_metabinner_50 TaxID=2970812 RepID=UPI0025FA5FD5|nr:hypothetical protein [Chamaesiphon sp. GL140_3_metabinner_50]